MAIAYKLHPLFVSDNYHVRYPFPQYPMVFSESTYYVLVGTKIHKLCPENYLNIFGFIDDYLIAGTINEEIFKNFNSEEEYREFIYSAKKFVDNLPITYSAT